MINRYGSKRAKVLRNRVISAGDLKQQEITSFNSVSSTLLLKTKSMYLQYRELHWEPLKSV